MTRIYVTAGVGFINFVLYFVWFPSSTTGLCTFPDDIRDNWMSSEKDTLNFTNTTVYGYEVNNVFQHPTVLTFYCKERRGDLLLLKAEAWHGIAPQLCIEFYRISNDKYTYQIVNNYDSQAQDRVTFNTTGTIQTVCNRPRPFEISTYNILLREGSTEDGNNTIMCPSSLFHVFTEGDLSRRGISCTGNRLDICEDRTVMTFIAGPSCPASVKPPGGATFVCLHKELDAVSGLTYLYIWDNSSTVITSNPLICMAFQAGDKSLQGTLYPGTCDHNPSGNLGNTGITMHYKNTTKSCQDIVVVTPSIIGLIAGAAGGVLVLGLLIALTVYLIKTKKCRCLAGRRKVGQSKKPWRASQDNMSIVSLSQDENLNLFVAKAANKIGPVVIPDLHPPPYVELLYQVETKIMSNKRTFDKNTVFLSDLSLRSK